MRAADIMTPTAISVLPGATIDSAIRLMLQNDISGLPVVDAHGALVGVVTEGDFLRRAEIGTDRRRPRWLEFIIGPGALAGEYIHSHGRTVADIMTPNVVTVDEMTNLRDVVGLMEKHRIKRVPVMRAGKMVGLVSRSNLLQALATLMPEKQAVQDGDSSIRTRLLAELGGQSWSSQRNANIIVKDGVVDFYGVIFDGREREALRVAAENTPGVKKVRDHLIWIEPHTGLLIDDPSRTDEAPSPSMQ